MTITLQGKVVGIRVSERGEFADIEFQDQEYRASSKLTLKQPITYAPFSLGEAVIIRVNQASDSLVSQ